jgi:hypothetical protein
MIGTMLIMKKTSPSVAVNNEHRFLPFPFIVGASRSGTTLFRLMLDAHPELAIPHETPFMVKLARKCAKSDNPNFFVDNLTSAGKWPDYHLETASLKQAINELDPFNVGDAVRTFYRLYATKFGKTRWGDKTPKNIGDMEEIQELLPEARFIHVIRDGRDVALSINKAYWGPSSVRDAAKWWRSRIEKARRQVKVLNYYMEIRYEDLVLHTEEVLRETCAFIDLRWDPSMLDYWQKSAERLNELQDTVIRGGQIRKGEDRRNERSLTSKPPQKDRIGCWKNEMNDADKECFAGIAGELLVNLGYDARSAV